MFPLRLIIFCDRPSASQEVHLFRPLRRLCKTGDCILRVHSEQDVAELTKRYGNDWVPEVVDSFHPQAVIFSRYAGEGVESIIATSRARDVPIVTHLDDFLLEIPPELGEDKVRHHMQPKRIQALRATLDNANILYISTQNLADRIREEDCRTPIIVSHLQSCADPDEIVPPAISSSGTLVMGYQGTRGHLADLQMIVPALLSALTERPSVRFELFGTIQPPKELLQLGSRLTLVPPADNYSDFLLTLSNRRWHIGLAPLRPTAFNTYRTFTKWTEYTLAGVPCIASDCPAYRAVIGSTAGKLVPDGGWKQSLLAAIDDEAMRLTMITEAQAVLSRSFTLEKQEQQVLAMLRCLF
jgi:hypothetical protein